MAFFFKFDLFLEAELSGQLDNWLGAADLTHGPARAIIAPHAGYSYCGACAGFAYRQVSPAVVKRVFILGPSHHVRLRKCALSICKKYETPLYDLKIDTKGKWKHFFYEKCSVQLFLLSFSSQC